MLVYHVAGTILPVLTAALLQRTAGRFGIFPGVERPHLFFWEISLGIRIMCVHIQIWIFY
jgi:hypothetical protein